MSDVDDLEDLYREIILDHYRSPRNRGELECPPATRTEGYNPLCGDEIAICTLIRDGRLEDIRIAGHGCSISQASSSLMSAAVKGRDLSEVRQRIGAFKDMMTNPDATVDIRAMGELAALQGVVKFPARIKCATLAWNTLTQAIDADAVEPD